MDAARELLVERQKLRYKILRTMYDATIGENKNPKYHEFSPKSLAAALKLEPNNVLIELQYLEGEYLAEMIVGMSEPLSSIFQISHQGIVEIEHSIEHPNQRTEHFMMTVVQHFHGSVGAVQNAEHSQAYVNSPAAGGKDA